MPLVLLAIGIHTATVQIVDTPYTSKEEDNAIIFWGVLQKSLELDFRSSIEEYPKELSPHNLKSFQTLV